MGREKTTKPSVQIIVGKKVSTFQQVDNISLLTIVLYTQRF
ncbi:unnamed protein product [Brassica rapa subsp. trilocularis]